MLTSFVYNFSNTFSSYLHFIKNLLFNFWEKSFKWIKAPNELGLVMQHLSIRGIAMYSHRFCYVTNGS